MLGSKGINLLARTEETAVILLLELGSDIVEGYEGRSSVDIIFALRKNMSDE